MPHLNRENHSVAESQQQPFLLKISSGTCASVISAGTCARMIYAGRDQSGWRNRHSAIQSANPLPWGPQFLSALKVPGRLPFRSTPQLETSLQGLGNLPLLQPPKCCSPHLRSRSSSLQHPSSLRYPHPLLFYSVPTPTMSLSMENSFIYWKLRLVQGMLPLRNIRFFLRDLMRTVLLTPKEQTTNWKFSLQRGAKGSYF